MSVSICEVGLVQNNFNQGSGYFSIVRKNDLYHLYFRRSRDYSNTIHMTSSCGLKFKLRGSIISDSFACHNFSAFTDADKKIAAIGGQISDPIRMHSSGLFLFRSDDGDKFKEKTRILSEGHPGYINGREIWGLSSELDGQQCCVFDSELNQYFLFVRSNPKRGVRKIQYAKASMLEKFGSMRQMKLPDSRKFNYYSSFFFVCKNVKFAFLPAVNRKVSCIRLLCSYDWQKWRTLGDFFIKSPWFNSENEPKMCDHPVQGVFEDSSNLYIYVHHNNLGHQNKIPAYIKKYKINKESLMLSAHKRLSPLGLVRNLF
ncbi:hypothetical protein GFK91_14950 [Roseibium aggregatum]|uniref:hypothetical protein n=1 Tax=Roseibium aggregatum TaxID=187304 RepID=UPI001E581D4B|nr:hypothetical protein [Roseibium aggregatum]UES56796.1 hypothetical protein GFK91_14950 [Roseibium aggregatum]